MISFELAIVGSPDRKPVVLGEAALVIGRSPTADIILPDGRVSWVHARLWVADGAVRLADRGSRNGTFVDGVRVVGVATLAPDAEIDVAGVARFAVREGAAPAPPRTLLLVEDLDTGIRYPFRDRTFDLRQLVAEPGAGPLPVLRAVEGGAVALLSPDREETVACDVAFSVGGLRLALRSVVAVPVSTQGSTLAGMLPYTVAVSLERSHASIAGPAGNPLCEIPGEVGAAVVYVLARALASDAPLPENERGWRDDQEIAALVWGRSGRETALNRLKVTLFRLRQRLSACGVDAEIVERTSGRTRLRAARVQLLE